MARNRVIYQSEALYAVKTGSPVGTPAEQIIRVQDVSHTVDIARQDVNEFGKLAAISRSVVEPPTVGTDFTYYLGSGDNEVALGLVVKNLLEGGGTTVTSELNAISGLIGDDGNLFQKNLYVRTVPEGKDVAENTAVEANSAIGIGNAFITDWSLNAAVGDIPTVSISTEGLNMNVTTANSVITDGTLPVDNPAVKLNGDGVDVDQLLSKGTTGSQSFAALRPGDVTLSLGANESMGGAVLADMHIQNCSVSLPLSRSSLTKLGSKYPYYKAVDLPINASMSVSAIMSTAVAGNLSGMLCGGSSKDLQLDFKLNCEAQKAFTVKMKGAELDSQNFSSSIGDNQTVDLSWSAQVGGPEDSENGVFLISNPVS